jgi:hypothetical protein
MPGVRIALACLALVALAASCGGGEGPAPASPSSAFPSGPTALTEATGGTGATGVTDGTGTTGATGGPDGPSGSLSGGEVSLQVSGDVELETTISTLVSGVVTPPPGTMAVVWTAGGTDATTVGIGGTSFTGTRPTSLTLTLTISVQTSEGIGTFLSMDGECSVTIDIADADELAGSFACDDLEDPTGSAVDVSASFRAAG